MGQIVEETKRRGMRPKTYLGTLSALAATSALLYWEQIALLFVISTLALCILLLIVAFSDLEGRDSELSQSDEPLPQSGLRTT